MQHRKELFIVVSGQTTTVAFHKVV